MKKNQNKCTSIGIKKNIRPTLNKTQKVNKDEDHSIAKILSSLISAGDRQEQMNALLGVALGLTYRSKTEQALEKLAAILREYPEVKERSDYFWIKGKAYYRQGQYPLALKAYDSAIQRYPNDIVSYAERASVKKDLGDMEGYKSDCAMTFEIEKNLERKHRQGQRRQRHK